MMRIIARAAAWVALLTLLALGAAPARAQAPDAGDDRARARQLFAEGLALVDRGDFAGAIVAFKEAYASKPASAVLWNIGQAYVALDRPAEAIAALERYLREGGDEIDPSRRAAVVEQIARQRARLDASPAAAPAPVALAPPRAAPPEPGLALRTTPTQVPPPPRFRAAGFALAGTGVALLATALGLYLWNDARYDRWRGDFAATMRPSGLSMNDIAIRNRRLNDRREAIRAVDRLTWGTAAFGALVGATGALALRLRW